MEKHLFPQNETELTETSDINIYVKDQAYTFKHLILLMSTLIAKSIDYKFYYNFMRAYKSDNRSRSHKKRQICYAKIHKLLHENFNHNYEKISSVLTII